jgi:hypothetical protein
LTNQEKFFVRELPIFKKKVIAATKHPRPNKKVPNSTKLRIMKASIF